MATKSQSLFRQAPLYVPSPADAELIAFVRSIVESAQREFGDAIVTEPNLPFHPVLLYTETHYALTATLLFCLEGRRAWLDLAESRLRLWNDANGPATFFNAMAVCLTKIVFARSGERHEALESVLEAILARTREHRHIAYDQWCGNNAYLQQVAVDTLLLPIARNQAVHADGLQLLVQEFRRYVSPEGFFHDLPRSGTDQERMWPPTYIMKMLFLAGVCHELHPSAELADLFQTGMRSAIPLLTREGDFSYFGRTDNSPFAAGLTIFNLRKAAGMLSDRSAACWRAAAAAQHRYQTFPRTQSGLLQSNRFGDTQRSEEITYSRDEYAFTGQYSLASAAYALLGCHWFSETFSREEPAERRSNASFRVAQSRDLGLVKLDGPDHELILRTRSEFTALDRRYLGPTILRYTIGDRQLIGAIAPTVSTDRVTHQSRYRGPLGNLFGLFSYRWSHGFEQCDGTTVGFLPIIRDGAVDYVPHTATTVDAGPTHVRVRCRMLKIAARKHHACVIEAQDLFRKNVRGLRAPHSTRLSITKVDSFELLRNVYLDPDGCRIEDQVSGPLHGKRILFSTRRFPSASISVHGLMHERSLTGWSSDGRHILDVYTSPQLAHQEFHYTCAIASA